MSIALLHHSPASCPLSSSTIPGRDPVRAARNPSAVLVTYQAAHDDEHYGRVLDMVSCVVLMVMTRLYGSL